MFSFKVGITAIIQRAFSPSPRSTESFGAGKAFPSPSACRRRRPLRPPPRLETPSPPHFSQVPPPETPPLFRPVPRPFHRYAPPQVKGFDRVPQRDGPRFINLTVGAGNGDVDGGLCMPPFNSRRAPGARASGGRRRFGRGLPRPLRRNRQAAPGGAEKRPLGERRGQRSRLRSAGEVYVDVWMWTAAMWQGKNWEEISTFSIF